MTVTRLLAGALVALSMAAGGCRGEAPAAQAVGPYVEPPELTACREAVARETDREKARAVLKEALAKSPQSLDLHRFYQSVLEGWGEQETLRREYREQLDAAPQSPMANYLYGRVAGGLTALAHLKKSVDLDGRYYWGHLGLAYYYANEAVPLDPAAAKQHLLQAVEIDPKLPNAYVSLLRIYQEEGDADKTASTLEVLTKIFPAQDDLFLRLAGLKLKDPAAYRAAIEARMKERGRSALLLRAVGVSHFQEGRKDDALKTFEEALSDPKAEDRLRGMIHLQLANLYGEKKDAARTLEHLRGAMANGLLAVSGIQGNPNFEFLKDDPEFKKILTELDKTKD